MRVEVGGGVRAGVFGVGLPVFGALLGSSFPTLGERWRFEVAAFGPVVVTESLMKGDATEESELWDSAKPSGEGAVSG